jgi:hypothetical protein
MHKQKFLGVIFKKKSQFLVCRKIFSDEKCETNQEKVENHWCKDRDRKNEIIELHNQKDVFYF